MKINLSLKDWSLQTKIILAIVAGAVIGLGLFSWFGLQAVKITTQRTMDERLSRARMAADLLDENLTHVLRHVGDVSATISDINSTEQFDVAADSLGRILMDVGIPPSSVMLLDANGHIVQVKSDGATASQLELSKYPDMVNMFEKRTQAISNALVDEDGRQVAVASSLVRDRSGATIGVVAVVADISLFMPGVFSQGMHIGDTGYAEVVDGNGVVISRTQPALPPAAAERSDHPQKFSQLISEGKAAVRTCHRCHIVGQENIKRKRDVLAFAPISMASWGVALRQSEEEALGPTHQLQQRLIFTGIIIVVGMSLLIWAILRGIIAPIHTLIAATQRIAAGDFKTNLPRSRRDEIGRLNTAFRAMTDELFSSRERLLARNRELSVLNSIVTTVSQSLDQNLVLENALVRVLEITHARDGCVFLADSETGTLVPKVKVERSFIFDCQEAGFVDPACACYQVWRTGQIAAIDHAAQCPLLKKSEYAETSTRFVAIPLRSRARMLGVMNVRVLEDYRFTDDDFKLLESIGRYVGLAIENSILYEEARLKEELRGQLLTRAINAQEDERKRISRELHDEHGQTLTGLIMNLDKMESMISPEQPQLKVKLGKARALVTRLLNNVRVLTLGLRPPDLDDLGLIAAITSYAEERLESAGITPRFQVNFNGSLAPAIETALFRIIQEAINNVIKHAEAKNVLIQLALEQKQLRVVVEDDGQGFEQVTRRRDKEGSLGLLSMRERIELLGGTFSIVSHPGKGTRLVIEIPVLETASTTV